MKLRALLLVASVPLVTLACASSPRPFSADGPTARGERSTSGANLFIEVRNGYYLPVRVFVDWPGSRRFIGDVQAGSVQRFALPAELVRQHPTLRLYADPEGSIDSARTGPLKVHPGNYVSWTLNKVLDSSRAYVM